MNSMLSRALLGTLVAGGITLFGAAAAQAAENTTSGEDGLLSGTQAILNVDVPITVGDTAVSVIGDSRSSSDGSAPAASSAPASASTSGADGTASGSQAVVDVSVPITVGDTAISVIGDSSTGSTGSGSAPAEPAEAPGASTDGSDGIGSGTQVIAPITAPVTVDDVAVSVIGDSTTGSTDAGTSAPGTGTTAPGSATTDGSDGIGSGTQVIAPITAPVTVDDVAVSVIGDSTSTGGGKGDGAGEPGTPVAPVTSGENGIGSGTQVIAPITAPVTVDDVAVSVIGDSTSTGGSTGDGAAEPGTPVAPVTSGENGIGSGTQIVLPIDIPITVGDTAVSVIGDSSTGGPGTTPTNPGTDPTDPGTDPTNPGTNPGTDPTNPGTDPTSPGTDPTVPGTDPTNPGAGPGTQPGDTPGKGTDDQIPGAADPNVTVPAAPTGAAATPATDGGTTALAQTGGTAVVWLPLAAAAAVAAGALLLFRRRTA